MRQICGLMTVFVSGNYESFTVRQMCGLKAPYSSKTDNLVSKKD